MSQRKREKISSVIRSIVMILLALICAIPLYIIVINTFKTSSDMAVSPFGLPKQFTLSNYSFALNNMPLGRAILNTLIVTICGVAFQVIIGSLAAYGIVQRRSRFTAALGAFLMISFIIPGQTLLIPQYKAEANLGLVNTLTGLVVLYLAGATFCYFLIVQYMRGLPQEIFESARIDGAGPFRIYWQIILPLCRPIMTTVIVFQTMGTWNDFMTPNIYLSSPDKQTLVQQVFNAIGQFSTNWPLFMTITTIALIPVFIFFIFCQKWIVSGLVAGAVKG